MMERYNNSFRRAHIGTGKDKEGKEERKETS